MHLLLTRELVETLIILLRSAFEDVFLFPASPELAGGSVWDRLTPECDEPRSETDANVDRSGGSGNNGLREGYVCRCERRRKERVSDGLSSFQCFSRHCSTNKLQVPQVLEDGGGQQDL